MSDEPRPPRLHRPLRVVIAGGGVAALEALIALRAMAADRVEVVLVSASDEYVYRPLLVGEPFGLGRARRYELAQVCAGMGAELVRDRITEVLPDSHAIRTAKGAAILYDVLLVALGARPYPPFEHGVMFERELSPEDFDDVLVDAADRLAPRIAVVVPDGVSWSLPAYELAMLTATWSEIKYPGEAHVTLVTHEAAPLAQFGSAVSADVDELLAEAGVVVRCGVHPDVVTPSALRAGGQWLHADRIVSLPLLAGPRLAGLPADAQGFVAADGLGRVDGVPDVYVAGDCGTFPIKQGGLAAQQAVAAATDIAARSGADVRPRPMEPVLRALLLTPQGPRYLRAELPDVERTSTLAVEPLWWPPSKIASRYLAPHLAQLDAAAIEERS